MQVISNRSVWYTLSGILVGGSILAVAIFGIKQGIDFTGGSQMTVRFAERPTPTQVQATLAPLNLGDVTLQPVG